MIINFGDFTIQEAQVILTALRKLPMEVVEQLHARMLATANEQFLAQQPQVNPEDITIVKKAGASEDASGVAATQPAEAA